MEVSEVQRLIKAEQTESLCLDQEDGEAESVGDYDGNVELAETVTVPPFSVRIVRCRIVRRDDSAILKPLGISKYWWAQKACQVFITRG